MLFLHTTLETWVVMKYRGSKLYASYAEQKLLGEAEMAGKSFLLLGDDVVGFVAYQRKEEHTLEVPAEPDILNIALSAFAQFVTTLRV